MDVKVSYDVEDDRGEGARLGMSKTPVNRASIRSADTAPVRRKQHCT